MGVSWQEPAAGLPRGWRDRSLVDAGEFFVLATSEDAAQDVAERGREMLEVFAEAAGSGSGKGLVLALDTEDAALLEDPLRLSRQIEVWHAQVTGGSEKRGWESESGCWLRW